MARLSAKQQSIVRYIDRFLSNNGYPPSIRDIQSGCNISSTSVVDYNLKILERKQYIRRHAEISRGIELLHKTAAPETTVQVPIIGLIAAGEPMPVPTPDTWDVAAVSDTIEIPRELSRKKKGVYALRVKGTSMIDALINDGDIVLMQYVKNVESGEMAAVWLRNEKEVTLKKVYVERSRVRLQPANAQMKPIFAAPGNVEIQGRVIAVIRQVA